MMVIDGTNLIMGRLASAIAQKLLTGEKINVVNSQKIIVTGKIKDFYSEQKDKLGRTVHSNPHRGPKYPKFSDRMFRRIVRGMLPFKTKRGKVAFKNLKVFIGTPEEFKTNTLGKIPVAKNDLKKGFFELGKVAKLLGAV